MILFHSRHSVYGWLGNLSAYPVIDKNSLQYATAEHAYQSCKALYAEDRLLIRTAPTPWDAMRIGRTVVVRPDWESIKLDVMAKVIAAKFRTNPNLVTLLINTGSEELVEDGSVTKSVYWGYNPHTKKGHNHLGKVLMALRGNYQ